ncbi:zinc finger protein 665 isoform X2 [Kryptolebias marmoratus]|uniref:zinc finger protein 665 isoform X2 n=1 Tax=Kryptolebias marmoratus TaxID=37003 RepID=UPI0007F8C22B|nr:zinc finger protein 665 isoform X2 [Kryptolebias marmoratus]
MFFCSSGGSEPLSGSKTDMLRGIITEKLSTAAREILAVVERTVADYEEEASGFRLEISRQRRQLELLLPQEKLNKRALVPDLYSHEVVVVSEEREEHADVEEAESQSLPWNNADDDDEDEKRPETTSRPDQEDPKDLDCQIPPSSISKTKILREIITEKLSTAAQEISEVVERTVADEEEEEASAFRQEMDRQRRQLELLQPQVRLHRGDVEEAESQSLPWSHADDDDEDDEDYKRPTTDSRPKQADLKDPDYEISPRSVSSRVPSVRKRSGRLQISDLQNQINLKIRLLEDSQIEVLSTAVFKKSPIRDLKCSRGLQEADFLNILRSTFPQLANNEPFDVFMTDHSKKLRPLRVKSLTPEEISRSIRSSGNSALYIRLKEGNQKKEEKKESRTNKPTNDGTGFKTRVELQSCSSTSQQDEEPEEEEAENMESSRDREEAMDAGDDWKPDPQLLTNKPTRKRKAKLDSKKSKESKISCKVCGVWYRFQGSLIKHAWSHVDEQQDACGVCGDKFGSVEELKEHLRSYQNIHSCSDCGKTFVSVLSLKCHTAKHTGNSRFKCKVCLKSFTNQASLNTHFWAHVEEKPHKCDVCLKTFGLKAQLAVHRKTHSSQEKYQCDICKKSFNLRRSLTQHRLIHSEERHYACAVCEKRFKLEGSLKTHMKIHADRDRTFLCHICCKTFLSKSSLMAHIKIHSTEKPFVCSICRKSFAVTYDLKKHMRVHTGEAPYECSECRRCFRQKTNLDSHLKIHLGIKQFICGVCGKACSRREHLKVHMRTHNGERPYKCSVCEKTFTQSHCLKTHMKSHQTEESPVPGNQTEENPVPGNQTEENPVPGNQTEENPVPGNQTEENPVPDSSES